MDGIADAGGVVGRSATYAVAREEPVFVERCGRLYYEHWLGALRGQTGRLRIDTDRRCRGARPGAVQSPHW